MVYKSLISCCYFLMFLHFAVSGQTTHQGLEQNLELTLVDEIVLSEDDQPTGRISDFVLDREGNFYVLDQQASAVIIYNDEGEQVRRFGKKGRGPFEFFAPSLISIINDTVFVWDENQLKVMAFTAEGEPLLELTDFSRAVADIGKYNDYLVIYYSGGFEGPVVEVYDIAEKKQVRTFGKKTSEHIILMTLSGSGGFDVDRNDLLFTRADDPTLFQSDLNSFNLDTHAVSIPDFSVEPLRNSPHQIINTDKKRFLEYLAENSRTTDVMTLNDYYLVEAHTGILSSEAGNPFQKRVINFAVLDSAFNQIDTITFRDTRFSGSTMRNGLDNKIYNLAPDTQNKSSPYSITVWEVAPN